MTAEEAALLFRDGMMVATSGSTMGFPKATFGALAERIKAQGGLKIDLLCAGPLEFRVRRRPFRGRRDPDDGSAPSAARNSGAASTAVR